VVERSGRPRIHTLWTKPEADREFMRARKANRVMTVENLSNGSAAFGVIGFDHKRGHQFLVFPKPLEPFAGARVVGVKFDLVDQPAPLVPGSRHPWQPPVRAKRKTSAAPRPSPNNRVRVSSPITTPARSKPPHPAAENRTRRAPPAARARPAQVAADHKLRAAIRAALKELEAGKTVAAYQTLHQAAEGVSGRE
jgi:hypothetical protein